MCVLYLFSLLELGRGACLTARPPRPWPPYAAAPSVSSEATTATSGGSRPDAGVPRPRRWRIG